MQCGHFHATLLSLFPPPVLDKHLARFSCHYCRQCSYFHRRKKIKRDFLLQKKKRVYGTVWKLECEGDNLGKQQEKKKFSRWNNNENTNKKLVLHWSDLQMKVLIFSSSLLYSNWIQEWRKLYTFVCILVLYGCVFGVDCFTFRFPSDVQCCCCCFRMIIKREHNFFVSGYDAYTW